MITFTIEGMAHEFDDDKLALTEALAVKESTGMGVRMFLLGITMSEPQALQAMVWLAKTRAGDAVRFRDIDFDCVDLLAGLRRVEPQGDASDPTAGQQTRTGSDTGTTPSSDEPPTSESSPTT